MLRFVEAWGHCRLYIWKIPLFTLWTSVAKLQYQSLLFYEILFTLLGLLKPICISELSHHLLRWWLGAWLVHHLTQYWLMDQIHWIKLGVITLPIIPLISIMKTRFKMIFSKWQPITPGVSELKMMEGNHLEPWVYQQSYNWLSIIITEIEFWPQRVNKEVGYDSKRLSPFLWLVSGILTFTHLSGCVSHAYWSLSGHYLSGDINNADNSTVGVTKPIIFVH